MSAAARAAAGALLAALLFGAPPAPGAEHPATAPAPPKTRILTPGAPDAGRAAAEADARDIRAAIEGLHRALEQFFKDRKVEPVMVFYDGILQYFSPSGSREGPAEVRKRLLNHAPRVKEFRTRVSPMSIRVSGDVAWATCDVREEYTFDGQRGEEELISTYILERKPQGWRIVHEHQSLKFADGDPDIAP